MVPAVSMALRGRLVLGRLLLPPPPPWAPPPWPPWAPDVGLELKGGWPPSGGPVGGVGSFLEGAGTQLGPAFGAPLGAQGARLGTLPPGRLLGGAGALIGRRSTLRGDGSDGGACVSAGGCRDGCRGQLIFDVESRSGSAWLSS